MNKYTKIRKFRHLTRLLYIIALLLSAGLAQEYVMGGVMFFVLLGGAFFCGWFCPFGAIQEYVGSLGSKVLKKRYKLPQKYHKHFQWSRYAVFIIIPLGLGYLIAGDPQHSLISVLSSEPLAIASWVVIAFFVLIAFFVDRPYCNYFCTEGAKVGIISLPRIFTIKRDKDKCIDCKACDRGCPMNIEVSKKKQVRTPNCVNCFNCLSVCPKDALDYKFFKSKK